MQILLQIFVMFFLVHLDYSEVTGQHPGDLKFEYLTTGEGLTQNSVFSILHDSEGYMWFGTQMGLNKYNGHEIRPYLHDPLDSGSIRVNDIRVIYEDRSENLWIGSMGGGIGLYDRDHDNFINYMGDIDDPLTLSDNSIWCLYEDSQENFWICTSYGLNLMKRERGVFSHFLSDTENPNSISHNNVTAVYEDSRGYFWVGTTGGLNLMDRENGTFKRFVYDSDDKNSINSNHINTIYEDQYGTLWIGTSGGGLNSYDHETGHFTGYKADLKDPHSISANNVMTILEDRHGILWIGTESFGLDVFDRDQKIFYNFQDRLEKSVSLNDNSVTTIYESRDEILWVGTFTGGVNYSYRSGNGFLHYNQNSSFTNSLSSNSVRSFLEDDQGNFWIGTDGGGLNLFDRDSGHFHHYSYDPEDTNTIPGYSILSLEKAGEGGIWLGSYRGGMSLFNVEDETFINYRSGELGDSAVLNSDMVFALLRDTQGLLWVGMNEGGINLLNPEKDWFISYIADPDTPEGLNNNDIRSFFEDSRGNIWIGSYGGSLINYERDTGSFVSYDINTGHLYSSVFYVHEDVNGILWLATMGGGLKLFDPYKEEVVASYSMQDGLPSNILYGILGDDNGHIWLSSNNGLSRFEPESGIFTNYNIEDGIQGREFNQGAYYKDSFGYLYFGGVNGFNLFHPDSIKVDETVSPLVLTDFQIFNNSAERGSFPGLEKHISRVDYIELPHTASVLTFRYTTLNFNRNKGDQFAYMLEGFDSDWNHVNEQRAATYTNLNPGEYRFRVKAANKDGIWSESEATVALMIIPPYWQTSWFYLLCILFVAGVAGGGIRRREKKITEQKARLEDEVARQTSELFEKNSELRITLKELKEARSELVEKAHKAGMADLATNVLHNVGNILNSVNVSASMIDETLKKSKLQGLKQANQLIRENAGNLENFILNDPRGQKLLHYYVKLEEPLNREQEELSIHNLRLTENIKLMIDVVAAQQSYSTAGRVIEHLSLEELIEDTLVLQSASIERHSLDLITDYKAVNDIYAEKTKVVHILVNLLKNAKESMEELAPDNKVITLKTFQDEDYVYLSITDNGCGVPAEDLNKIFNHGYTTKSYGHGFGLHSCANYMNELKGEIRAESEGPGKGATFTLCFPRKIETVKKLMKSNPAPQLADIELK